MSNVGTAYDNFKSRVDAVLTSASGWKKLTNPYDITDNDATLLTQGWGVGIGSATNTNRQLSCQLSQLRNIDLVLSRENIALENDLDSKQTIEKTLIEDLLLVIKDLERNTTLNNGQIFASYVSDSGIEAYRGDNYKFLTLRATFTTEVFVDLNT